MDDLIAFLRARLDEDAALATSGETWSAFDESTQGTRRVDVDHSFERVVACTRSWRGEHIARHDPARTLREVDAKRVLLADYERFVAERRSMMGGWDSYPEPSPVLTAFAAVYADHPDYRPEWRP
ncbi:hypothetical protein EAO72_26485 [Streptomyces sp. or43]|nr:hypothetical protein EAO72_26485 [Streptomyces sp. or43]